MQEASACHNVFNLATSLMGGAVKLNASKLLIPSIYSRICPPAERHVADHVHYYMPLQLWPGTPIEVQYDT